MARFASFVALALFALVPRVLAQDAAPAPTDAQLAEARHSFDVATGAFESGDYETAVSEFQTALDLSGAADLYFNIYLSQERQGHLPEAADALDQYLQRGTVDDEQRALLTGRLERLRARIASHTPTSTAEEPQTLLASPIAVAPAPEPEPVAPEPAPRPEPVVTTSPPIVPIVLLALGGALLVNFAVFAGLAAAENDRIGVACGSSCTSGDVAALNTYDIVADVSWISGAAIALTGLVLFFVLPADTHEETPSVAFAPMLGPSIAGLSARGSF